MKSSERPSDPRERQQQQQAQNQPGNQPGNGQHRDRPLSLRELLRLIRSLEEGLAQIKEDLAACAAGVEVLSAAARYLKQGHGGNIDYDPMTPKSERPTEADRRAAIWHAAAGIRAIHIVCTEDDQAVVTMDELPPVAISNLLCDLLIALCRGERPDGPYRTEWFSPRDLASRVGYDVTQFDDRMKHNVVNLINRLRDAIPNRHLIITDDMGRYRFLLRQGGNVTIIARSGPGSS